MAGQTVIGEGGFETRPYELFEETSCVTALR
jgi:hypothetical protein